MKRSHFPFDKLLIAGLFMLGFTDMMGQKSFEGSISYSISLTGKAASDMMLNEPPKKMDLHIKDDNFILSLSGGRIPRTFLFIGDSSETYSIDMNNQKAYKNTYYRDTVTVVPVAKPTGKSVVVKGDTCQEYVLERPSAQETIYYYVVDKYRVDSKLYEGKKDAKADFLTPGLEGRIPLKKVIQTPNVTTEISLMSIKPKALDASNFQIPEGFVVKKRDPRL